ncbi:hypothetical protein [Brachybacterium sp. YJGR34]|uniref:hypothetical protein n=1 Tax=Brachybacterium sp. YJGR34 TaxID=2059911 RepID=UPI000E0A0087|nr:hypothetical protein [Brachybacterium sp. YJGR34]
MSRAADALQQWIEEAGALEPDERAPALRATDLAGGFAVLVGEDQDRLLQLMMTVRGTPDWELFIAAIGSAKDTGALETKLLPLWLEHGDQVRCAGDFFVLYALMRGRGKDAARVVVRLRKFSAYSGLIAKLDTVIDDLPLDDELLTVAAEALRASSNGLDATVLWGLSAYLLRTGRPQDMDGVVGAFDAFLTERVPRPRLAGRLCEIIDTYARGDEATRWAEDWNPRLRATLARHGD